MFIQFVDVNNELLHAYDNAKSLDIVYLDFQKAFDKVPRSKLMFKVKQLGISGKLHNRNNKQTKGSYQWHCLGLRISHEWRFTGLCSRTSPVHDIHRWHLNSFISKFADDTKIGNAIVDDRYRFNLQEALRKISKLFERWQMPFNINKCHILHVGTRNQKFDYEINCVKLDSVQCVKDLGVSTKSNLNFSRQCKDAAGKANRMLGFINRNFSFKNKDIILPHSSLT